MICSKCGGETGGSDSTTTRPLCTCNTDRNPKDETDYEIGYKYGYDNGYKAAEKENEKLKVLLQSAHRSLKYILDANGVLIEGEVQDEIVPSYTEITETLEEE